MNHSSHAAQTPRDVRGGWDLDGSTGGDGTPRRGHEVDVLIHAPGSSVIRGRNLRSTQLAMVLTLVAGITLPLAQLPLARLANLYPPGGQAGSTFELTITGQDLDTATNLIFSTGGIQAIPKRDATTQAVVPNQFLVSVSTNSIQGVHEARAVGRFGISNPRAFAVGPLPETLESSTNRTVASAQTIGINTVVVGRSDVNARDFFRIALSKGVAACVMAQTRAIDSKLEPIVILRDAKGRELKRRRFNDPLEITANEDTTFVIEIHDVTFRGGEDFFYRLEIATTPVVFSVFPPSARAGGKASFTLLGRSLPGSRPWPSPQHSGAIEAVTVELDVPDTDQTTHSISTLGSIADAPVDSATLQWLSSKGHSNPFKVILASAPVVVESDQNETASQAQRLDPPCEWVGRFYPNGDEDWAWFEAKKGDVYWIEVWSQRLGNPTDPFLLIERLKRDGQGGDTVAETLDSNDQDTNVGGREFKTSSPDPALRVEAKEDCRYRIRVEDLFNVSRADASLTYRVTISKESPDYSLVVTPLAPPPSKPDSREAYQWSNLIRRSGTMPLRVLALRRHGFANEIELSVEGLPPGVSVAPTKMEAGKSSSVLLLTAAATAAAWTGPVRVLGVAKIGDREIRREAKAGTLTWAVPDFNTEPVVSRLASRVFLGVSGAETQPVRVVCATNSVLEAPEGAKLSIPLQVVRAPDWASGLKLKAAGISALDNLKELELDGKATNATLEIDLAAQKLTAGTYQFHLQGSTQGKYRNDPESAKEIEQKSKELEQTAVEAAKLAKEAREAVAKTPEDQKEARLKLEQAAQEAESRQKDSEARRDAAKKVAKEASEKAQPKDVTMMVYSEPIIIKVTAKAK